ncbi:MAG: hypothetical protein QF570_07865 [Myxococcota bacterium]|jgi:hypothetical protein|nr:hypothetical protein [Myxococcota bacterium]
MNDVAWRIAVILVPTLLLAFLVAPVPTVGAEPSDHRTQLGEAWGEFVAGLERAQASLTDPKDFPPAPTERNLAEGYRYALGHIGRMIELEMRMDPRFPEFHRSIDMLRKWTAENPDTMYLKAPLDPNAYYRVRGTAADTREWRDSSRGRTGPKAPRMVTFQTITDVPGATGELAEMAQCKSQTLAFINVFDLKLEGNRFEILIGPEEPADHRGNFLPTRKTMTCASTGETGLAEARWLAVREIFSDWEFEAALELDIVREDAIGETKAPIDAAFVAKRLKRIGDELPKQIRFWNLLQKFPLEMRDDANGDGRRNLPLNGINQPAPPFTAGGVAGSRQLYASGLYQLAPDEALVVKVTAPVEPHYIGMQLGNLWFEGPDQQNHVSSLSGHQLPVSSDGSRYYIISIADPGYQGWVATTGYDYGQHAMRFVFREDPPADKMPTAEAFVTKLKRLDQVLPADTPRITPEQRRAEIAIRQAHIKRRWRAY